MIPGRGRVWDGLCARSRAHGSAHLVLVDPDRASPESAAALALECAEAAVDAFLLGSSTPLTRDATPVVRALRRGAPSIPILLFPGGADQLHDGVDAVLFLSLLSGRDARFLIGEQLRAAPRVLASGIEPIATAYLLVGDAEGSSVARVTGTAPLPIEPAAGVIAHAQAAACLGMSLVYLEGGSGAKSPLPASFVRAVAAASPLPIAVGGGVRRPNEAAALAAAGARFIVTGTAHEQGLAVRPFTEAVHGAAVTV